MQRLGGGVGISTYVQSTKTCALWGTPRSVSGDTALGVGAPDLAHMGSSSFLSFLRFLLCWAQQSFWLQTTEIPVATLSRKGCMKGC